MEEKRLDLSKQIIYAMIFGLVVGVFFSSTKTMMGAAGEWINSNIINGLFFVGGKLFINSLKMLVVPLVFVSLVCGVCAARSGVELGRIGGKTFLLYVGTTAIAVTIALALGLLINPGHDTEIKGIANYVPADSPSIKMVIINLIPNNVVKAMTDANMLQIIVFSILLGFSINRCGDSGKQIRHFFEDANHVVLAMVLFIMQFAPIGVFCLVTQVFAENGIGILIPLAAYVFTVILALLVHACGTFSCLLMMFTKLNPIKFLKKAYPALLFAFSTASSAATMPITLRIAEKSLGIKNSVASFTVPMGATINMDGTAIMQGVATVFIAGAYGVDLTLIQLLTVIAIATLASIGTAAVPGAGIITLSMVLIQVGLPTEAIGLILGVDRILDMMRTAVNVCGDMVITTVVAKSEDEFDRSIFDSDAVVN